MLSIINGDPIPPCNVIPYMLCIINGDPTPPAS